VDSTGPGRGVVSALWERRKWSRRRGLACTAEHSRAGGRGVWRGAPHSTATEAPRGLLGRAGSGEGLEQGEEGAEGPDGNRASMRGRRFLVEAGECVPRGKDGEPGGHTLTVLQRGARATPNSIHLYIFLFTDRDGRKGPPAENKARYNHTYME
jgi:hypothetical protein